MIMKQGPVFLKGQPQRQTCGRMKPMTRDPSGSLVFLIPVFNDWESLVILLERLDKVLQQEQITASVLIVDDGSTVPMPEQWSPARSSLVEIKVLRLKGNIGHQRALAVGLSYLEANWPCQRVLIMDADGEDNPEDVPRLLARSVAEGEQTIVFAARIKRSEGWFFRTGYVTYRVVHRLLTGLPVKVGNFSVVPFTLLSRLVILSDLWNHYAAAVFKSRTPYVTEPSPRCPRIAGRSSMNYISLIVHGFSAMAVFGDRIGVRLLVLNLFLLAAVLAGIATVLTIQFGSDLSIPVWATSSLGFLLVLLLIILYSTIVFVLLIAGNRGGAGFLPIRDCSYFIASVRTVQSGT
jgi:glycosyltransferase involved in cell wall biosynthesis